MARDPFEAYDNWFLKQEEKVDDFIDTIDDPEDPREKLKRYDRAIEKAEALLLECRKREAETEGLYENSKDAQKKLDGLIKDKDQYLSEWFEEDLAEYLEDEKERQEAKREAAKEKKKRNLAKERILATLMDRKEITLVELEKMYPEHKEMIRSAASELDQEGRIEHFKIKNRIAVKLCTEKKVAVAPKPKVRKLAPKPDRNFDEYEQTPEEEEEEEGVERSVPSSGFANFAAKERSLSEPKREQKGSGNALIWAFVCAVLVAYFIFS